MNEVVEARPTTVATVQRSSRTLSLDHLRAVVLRRHHQLHRSPGNRNSQTDLQTEIGWTEVGYSWVVFSFQAAYAIGFTCVGRLMDRIGTRKGFSLSIIFWSLAAMGHALARTVFGFGVARFFWDLVKLETFRQRSRQSPNGFQRRNARLQPGSSMPAPTSVHSLHHW